MIVSRFLVSGIVSIAIGCAGGCVSEGAKTKIKMPTAAIGNWQRVIEFTAGRRILVQLPGKQQIEAVMVSADDTTLSVQRTDNNRREEYARYDVLEISALPNKKARNGAIAVSIIGASTIFIGTLGKDPEAGPGPAYWIGLPMLVGGLIGLHHEPNQAVVIYRRPIVGKTGTGRWRGVSN